VVFNPKYMAKIGAVALKKKCLMIALRYIVELQGGYDLWQSAARFLT